MYAVIETGGKQYRVTPGDTIRVEKLQFDVGTELEFPRVLAVYQDTEQRMLAGPQLSAAKVRATVTGHGRGDKVIVFKFKRKKQYKRTIGHRQDYTQLKVGDILV
jgi:large subunit ribosomal protein L21